MVFVSGLQRQGQNAAMRVAEKRYLEGQGRDCGGGEPGFRRDLGAEMGLDPASPRQRAQLTARRIPEPVPAPRNQFPLSLR